MMTMRTAPTTPSGCALGQRVIARAFDHLPVRCKATTVAGAIPSSGGAVPVHRAFHVRANGRQNERLAVVVAVYRGLLALQRHDSALATRYAFHRLSLGGGQASFDEMLGHRFAGLEPFFRRLRRGESAWAEQLAQGRLAAANLVGDNLTGDHPPDKPVRRVPRAHVL